jgi:hypothetical protein
MVMGWPQPHPEAVQAALNWLREQDPRLSLDALAGQLRAAGYGNLDVETAIRTRQAELDAALPAGTDLRGRATAILTVAFLGVWGVISLALVVGQPFADDGSMFRGTEGLSAVILGVLLLPVLLIGLAVVRSSGPLRRGSVGAMAWILALPFIYLVIVAGTCVATTQPFSP